MAIQVRRGNEADFDPSKMLPGEWAVSLDTKYVRMCFSPGVCVRMATYEAFEEDMAKIEAILEEAQTIEEAIEKLQTEINATAVEVENFANSAEQSAKQAKEYAEAAAESASKAEALTGPVVSGIKGSAETDFRTGQVTISPDDLGLGDVLTDIETLSEQMHDYLPLGGGTLTGFLFTNHVIPSDDGSYQLGQGNVAYKGIYGNTFHLAKNNALYGNMKVMTEGTAEALGYTQLTLGNATPLGTEKNSRGQIALYGTGTGFVQITPTNSGSATFEVKLPSTGGTLALTSDITALNTLTTAEQNAVTYFIENVFPNQAVNTQSVPSGSFVTASSYYAWHGMHPVENFATYVLYGYNMRAIHMQLFNGVWTYNAMDNK